MPGRLILTAALLTVGLTAAGCRERATHAGSTPARTSTHTPRPHATKTKDKQRARKQPVAKATTPKSAAGTAAGALAELPVKGRAPKTGYSREQFGDGWIEVGGCDTRDRILARDLIAKTYEDGCRVESGTLADPYTAQRIQYTRGGASEVDVDHVVALLDAWQKGAQRWTAAMRVAFANDPLELLAVDAHANRSKGDGDAATWLPSDKAFRCAYVARQVAVKTKYKLWVTHAEKDAIGRELSTCAGQRLPAPGARVPGTVTRMSSAPTTTPSHSAGGGGSGTEHVYANCAAARAAGVTPIMRGTPDYAANRELDRDHDGIACESR